MEHKIVSYITADRYISRAELRAATGFSDRHVRDLIAQARRAGHMIVSNTHGGGYKIAANGAEWREFVERERRRAVATFVKLYGVPEAQMTLAEVTV